MALSEKDIGLCHNSPGPAQALDPRRWYVAHTEPRQEQSAATWLALEFSVQTYCPLIQRERPIGRDREAPSRSRLYGITQQAVTPLMPGYLLLKFDIENDPWKRFISAGLGLRRYMGTHPERPLPVPDSQVERIRALGRRSDGVIDLQALRPPTPPVPVGAKIRVLDGPFAGQQGLWDVDEKRRAGAWLSFLMGDRFVPLKRSQVEVVA